MKDNINLNLYKAFYDVATSESISDAAKENFVSQPSLSKSIKKLEDELGTKLFYRSKKGIKLTKKGEELLYYVKESFNNLQTAKRVMIEEENLQGGKLTIGVPSQIGTFYVFEKLANFHDLYPNIEITIISNSTKDLLKKLSSHEIDFIIDSSPVEKEDDSIIVKRIKDVSNSFIISKDFKCDFKKLDSLDKIKDYLLILPIDGTNNRKELNKTFKKNNVVPSNIMNIHTSEMIIGAVKRNLGIGYVITDLVENDDSIIRLDIKEELPTIEINLVYVKKYLTKAPSTFIKMYIDENFKI